MAVKYCKTDQINIFYNEANTLVSGQLCLISGLTISPLKLSIFSFYSFKQTKMNSDNPNFKDFYIATKTHMASVILNSHLWEQRDTDRKLSRIQTERKQEERALDWTHRRFYIKQVFDQNQKIRFPKSSGNQVPNVPKLRRAEGHDDPVIKPPQADQVGDEAGENPNKRIQEKKKKTNRELSKTKLKCKAKVSVEPDSNKIEEVLNQKTAEIICEIRERNVPKIPDEKRELSEGKLKGKAKVIVEPDSNKIEEVLNRKADKLCEMRERNVPKIPDEKRELSKIKLKGKAKVIVEPDSNKIEEVLNRTAAKICEMRERNVPKVPDEKPINNSASVLTLPCINTHRTVSSVYISRNNIKRNPTGSLQKPEPLLQGLSSRSANVTKTTKFGESSFPRPKMETGIQEVGSRANCLQQQSSKATDAIRKKIRELSFRKVSAKYGNVVIITPGFKQSKQTKVFLPKEVTNRTNKTLIPMPTPSQGNPQVSVTIPERLRRQNETQQDDVISKLTGPLPPKLMSKANESPFATLGNGRERLISREKEIVNRESTEDCRLLRLGINETLVASGE